MKQRLAAGLLVVVLAAAPAYAWNPFKKKTGEQKEKKQKAEAAETIRTFRKTDPGLRTWFKNAYGYAVFPTVGKGGMGIGGAYGKGEVFERGLLIGRTSLKQVTVGFQFGGQTYSEIIFFENKKALDNFKGGNFELDAQVSAVALVTGASADAAYRHGVAVFTQAKGGLMYEATVGGQKFTFDPLQKK